MIRDKFMFFRNMRDVIKSVPRDRQLELREAIEDYAFDGKEPEDWVFKTIIQSLKPSLDYVGRGAPVGNNNAGKDDEKQIKQKKQIGELKTKKTNQTKKQEAEAEAEAETEAEDEAEAFSPSSKSPPQGEPPAKAENKKFKKPTIDEINWYCDEAEISIDAEKFYDHYEANGWKIGGKSPMKDWKAAVRNWYRRDNPNAEPPKQDGEEEEESIEDYFARRWMETHSTPISRVSNTGGAA